MCNTWHRDRNWVSASFSLIPHTTYRYTQGSEQSRELRTRGLPWFCPSSLRSHNHIPLTHSPWPSSPRSLHDTSVCSLHCSVLAFSHKPPLPPPCSPSSLQPQLLVWLAVLMLLILLYKRLLNSFSLLRPRARPQRRPRSDQADYVHSFP